MYKLEDFLKTVFVVFLLALAVLAVISLVVMLFNAGVGLTGLLLSLVMFGAAAYSVVYRVPAVQLGIPESLITGRFRPEHFNECGCRVPIEEAKTEGLHLKWPWHKIHLAGRDIQTFAIDKQKYDIQRGAVIVSGLVQWRVSRYCAYRKLAISDDDIFQGINAIVDQVLVRKLIGSDLETALQLKEDLRTAIEEAFNQQAQVPDPNTPGTLIPRTLNGEEVSVSQHRYAVEIVAVNIDRIDPTEELAQARADVQVEALRKKKAEEQMKRLAHIQMELKKMYPELNDDAIAQQVELIEGLSSKERKLFGLSDINDLSELVSKVAGMFAKGGGK